METAALSQRADKVFEFIDEKLRRPEIRTLGGQ